MEELDEIRAIADEKGLEGEDRDDFIEAKMRRKGFKRGPGEWIGIDDDDDSPRDDDDEPVTRGDMRRMQRERKRESQQKKADPPPKVEKKEPIKKPKGDPWWR